MMHGQTGEYDVGERVRVEIASGTDPDHDRYQSIRPPIQ